MEEAKIGIVTHFFHKPMVAAIQIEGGVLKVGDKIHFKGHSTDFYETIESMEVEHQKVAEGKPGDLVGLKIVNRVREHDQVFKVTGG